MRYILNFQDIELASPIFLWIGLGSALLVLIFRFFARTFSKKQRGVSFVETETSLSSGFNRASVAYHVKTSFIVIMVALLGVIAAAPYTYMFEGAARIESTKKLRTTVAVLDVSGSMQGSYGFEDIKFNIVRNNLAKLLQQAENTRASVIFFSEESSPFRWFTHDTESLALDILNLEIKTDKGTEDRYGYFGLAQVNKLSRGTNTPRALDLAGYMLKSLDMSDEELSKSASIILFTDLQDNLDEVMDQIRAFSAKGIRVYVIAISRNDKINTFRQNMASANGLVYLFDVNSQKDAEDAFARIGAQESSLVEVEETVQSEKSLVPEFVQLLLFVILTLALFSETIFHNVRGGRK